METIGVTIDIPANALVQVVSDENQHMYAILVDDRADIVYMFALGYDEEFMGISLEEGLTDEDIAEAREAFIEAIADPQLELIDEDGVRYLVITSGDGTQAHYLLFNEGWITDVAVVSVGDTQLTEDEIALCMSIMKSIVYDE